MYLLPDGPLPSELPVPRAAARNQLQPNAGGNNMATPQDEFLAKMRTQFDELNHKWNVERNKLEARAQHLSADAKQKFEAEWEALDKLRRQMKEKIIDLEVAGENAFIDFKDGAEDAWGDVKEGTEKAWGALSDAFKKAASRFK
jgi:hypothetical protein